MAHGNTDRKTTGGRHLKSLILSGSACIFAIGNHAYAGGIDIRLGDCDTGVHLAANRQPLSAIMTRLSKELGFEFSLSVTHDPTRTLSVTRQPPDLIVALWPYGSSVIVEPHPRCAGRYRLVKVDLVQPGDPLRAADRASRRDRTGASSPDPAQDAENDYLRSQGVPVPE